MGLGYHKLAFANPRSSVEVHSFHLPQRDHQSYYHDRGGDDEAARRPMGMSPYEDLSLTSSQSRSFFRRIESSRFLQVFLRYPAPDSIRLKPTSWLDGVRGVAALEVYIFHTISCWRTLFPAYNSTPDERSILQLPGIRTFFTTGGAAVCVFFALSGYVLTYKSLQWMRAGSNHLVYPSVASSMFRRGFRLYLPPICLTFFEMLATRVGYSPPLNFDFTPESNLFAQVWDWLKETWYLVNPYYTFPRAIQGFIVHPKYDAVIWTIPIEFYGSFTVYLLLLLLARVPSSAARMVLVALFAALSMFLGAWNAFCFSSGMLIADYNLAQEEEEAEGLEEELELEEVGFSLRPTRYRHPRLCAGVFVLAMYITGFPTLSSPGVHEAPMPGFEGLHAMIPWSLNMEDHARWWWSLSGVAVLFCISQLAALKSLFETYFCQYLGKIAFSLYLMHQFCIILFGLFFQNSLLAIFGVATHSMTWAYWALCLLWYVPFTLLTFALAAQVERYVDAGSVKLARWLEGKCLDVYRDLLARRKGMYRPL
ncbi:acyltransferase [Diplocarpon rosae]|nr:acyltransferase [Diplocarpon rosae]